MVDAHAHALPHTRTVSNTHTLTFADTHTHTAAAAGAGAAAAVRLMEICDIGKMMLDNHIKSFQSSLFTLSRYTPHPASPLYPPRLLLPGGSCPSFLTGCNSVIVVSHQTVGDPKSKPPPSVIDTALCDVTAGCHNTSSLCRPSPTLRPPDWCAG